MQFRKRYKYYLFILLILLNILIRYFAANHELQSDSYEMHIMAKSLSEFGEARWWVNFLSIFGMYPNSYASTISFIISGLSQISGIDIEKAIFLYSMAFGLISVFAGYIVADFFYRNNDLYKFLVSFGFSLTPGILTYTTWTANARSPIIILLPIFLVILFNIKRNNLKFGLLTLIFSILLFATHHMFFYTIPIFIAFLIINTSFYIKKYIKNMRNEIIILVTIILFLLMISYPFFTHKFMTDGSRWDTLKLMFNEYPRYIGIFSLFSIIGFISLISKHNKKKEEWLLLLSIILLSVFIFEERYMKWFMQIFAILLAGIALMNIAGAKSMQKRYIFLSIILIVSLSLSSYLQYIHTYEKDFVKNSGPRSISENEYFTSLWSNKIENSNLISNSRWVSFRMGAISNNVFLTGSYVGDQIYGLVDVSEYELEKNPITSEEFWMSSPFKKVNGTDSDSYWITIMDRDYNNNWNKKLLDRFNITYFIKDARINNNWWSHHGIRQSPFVISVSADKEEIYNSGDFSIYKLN